MKNTQKTLLLSLILISGINALDLQEAVIKIDNKKLNTAILRMLHPYRDGSPLSVDPKDRKRFAENFRTKPWGNETGFQESMVFDKENNYFEIQYSSSVGGYERQFILLKKALKVPVLAITYLDSPVESDFGDNFSDIFFLCQKGKQWVECTKKIMQPIKLSDFLKSGEAVPSNLKGVYFLQYKLSRDKSRIEVSISFDRYDYIIDKVPAVQTKTDPANLNLDKFRTTTIYLEWNKKSRKYIWK